MVQVPRELTQKDALRDVLPVNRVDLRSDVVTGTMLATATMK